MHRSQLYIAIAIVALAIVGLLVFFTGKKRTNRLTPLVGYGLMGIGVILSIVDIVQRSKSK